MNPIVQYSLIMAGLLLLSITLVLLLVRQTLGKGLVMTFSYVVLFIVAIDTELGFILGQIGMTPLNLIITFGPGILVTLFLIFYFARVVVGPVSKLSAVAERMAVGDLEENVNYNHSNEIGHLAANLTAIISYQREMARLAHQIAVGKLQEVVLVKSEKDELGQAYQEMSIYLNTAIKQVADSAARLGSASTHLAATTKQVGYATGQISNSIQQVATGISQQSDSIGQTASSVEQMSLIIEGVAHGAQEQSRAVVSASEITDRISKAVQLVAGNARAVTERSADASEAARSGSKTVEETLSGMSNIRIKVGISADRVRELGSRSDQIGAIVETIDDIASQTNLLALNAAIEAARAGEHGKGFAVVADEVRKLAERSSVATREIGGLIKGIQSTVTEAVNAMAEGAREVEMGVASASQSGDALNNIIAAAEAAYHQAQEAGRAIEQVLSDSSELVTAIDAVSAVVEQNTTAAKLMSASSGDVTQAVEAFASISEENSAAIEEVSAAMEEMNYEVAEVADSTKSLDDMAQTLRQVVNQFSI